jgi:hypothetical protein
MVTHWNSRTSRTASKYSKSVSVVSEYIMTSSTISPLPKVTRMGRVSRTTKKHSMISRMNMKIMSCAGQQQHLQTIYRRSHTLRMGSQTRRSWCAIYRASTILTLCRLSLSSPTPRFTMPPGAERWYSAALYILFHSQRVLLV